VLGLATDPERDVRAFAESLRLTFPLLADTDGRVARAYGVYDNAYRLARRTTIVVAADGRVRAVQTGAEAMDPGAALRACGEQ
jgi:peroxiredoxin Q/BCP